MARFGKAIQEGLLGLKYAGVSLVGFGADAILLHILVAAGMGPAWARLISLLVAMQVTFVINGLHVFRSLRWAQLPGQWARYMVTNGFGNFWNYWIFVTLVSTHWPIISNRLFALTIGAFTAWTMNYASTRFLVFHRSSRAQGKLRVAQHRKAARPSTR